MSRDNIFDLVNRRICDFVHERGLRCFTLKSPARRTARDRVIWFGVASAADEDGY